MYDLSALSRHTLDTLRRSARSSIGDTRSTTNNHNSSGNFSITPNQPQLPMEGSVEVV
jgi:hypothetical protein